MRVTQGEQSQSHKGAQIWEDALSRSKEYGVGQQLLFLVLVLFWLLWVQLSCRKQGAFDSPHFFDFRGPFRGPGVRRCSSLKFICTVMSTPKALPTGKREVTEEAMC